MQLRNYISHNNVIYSFTVSYVTNEFVALYKEIFNEQPQKFKLIHLMKMIEHFAGTNVLISNTKYYYDKLKIDKKFKDRIGLFD